MKRRFNITGACVPGKHYMVDISAKISSIFNMIEQGNYFVINRPRQYGKTTTLAMLNRFLKTTSQYFPIKISFEGIGVEGFENAAVFSEVFINKLYIGCSKSADAGLSAFFNNSPVLDRIDKLGTWISDLVQKSGKKIVLMIDEVDKSSNNQLFLDFLGMLRDKYLNRDEEDELTFHSVILAGVHDVKSLKAKLRPDTEAKFNSPWNIAADFNIDLSFFPGEIQTMLEDYAQDQQVNIDIPLCAAKLFYLTSGYPFLVSHLCKIIHEKILPARSSRQWLEEDLDQACQISLKHNNTNFDSLIQNLENSSELYEYVFKIVMDGADFMYNPHDPLIHFGVLYGILKDEQGKVRVHNRVYEQIIYNYMTSKLSSAGAVNVPRLTSSYLDDTGSLDIQKVLLKFQQFMKENYSQKDLDFLERNGRLLFLAFLRPIINGRGFDFKEVQIAEEKRLDIVVTFDTKKYIIELKVWRGDAYHQKGLRQLSRYLAHQQVSTGYLLIFDARKENTEPAKWETVNIDGRVIVSAWV